ncbi:hypothetical protein HNP12_000638 [Aeromonas hydrophila]|uniref:hypothetical protein n=1 Tax=Aeromonas hydrophila TaxID=644 RepID=UPI002166E52C|nr:hypothetical protein [Aeromonas hydrophila]MCS3766590.1 hypothetical protein [Aeromonas hydrophila]
MKILKVVFLLSSIGAYGCTQATTPPVALETDSNAGTFFVSGKLQKNVEPLIYGIYISDKCKDEQLGFIGGLGSGSYTKIIKPGYQSYKPEITENNETGEFSAQLPKNGGSECNWSLLNVMLTLKVKDFKNEKNEPSTITINVSSGSNNKYYVARAKSELRQIVYGELNIGGVYYPSIETSELLKKRSIRFISNDLNDSKYAVVSNTKDTRVRFAPYIDLDYVVYADDIIDHKLRKINFTKRYPDGTVDIGDAAKDMRKYKFYEKVHQ